MSRSPRAFFVLLVATGLAGWLSACEERGGDVPPRVPAVKPSTFNASGLGSDVRATLVALQMKHARLTAGLGPHHFSARSELTTEGRGKRKVTVGLELFTDGEGRFRLEKKAGAQSGYEAIWTGERLYSRFRYHPYTRRALPGPGEAAKIKDEHYAMLAAYVRLLAPFLGASRGAEVKEMGRPAVVVTLSKRDEPRRGHGARARGARGSRRWRASIDVEALKGRVVFDLATGAPLRATLDATWTFALPGVTSKTGIPAKLSSERGKTVLRFEQRIDGIGEAVAIKAPPREDVVDVRRRRLEIERQMVTGERPLDPGWRVRWGDIERNR